MDSDAVNARSSEVNIAPQVPNNDGQKNSVKKSRRPIIYAIGATFIFLLILIGLNPTTVSKLIPQDQTTLTPSIAPSPLPTVASSPFKEVPIASCPLVSGCNTATQIGNTKDSYGKDFTGLGFNLNSTTTINSAIEGQIETKNITENGKQLSQITISNKNLNILITYKFESKSFTPEKTPSSIKENQPIGNLQKGSVVTYNSKNYSFIFSVQNITQKDYVKINPSSNGKTINSIE